jgi:2-iminobutanoate/2-iminopropanoate deaminase
MYRINTADAPQPAGHYSQGVVHNGTLYVSGQLPIDPQTGEKCLDSVEDQTRQTLKNVAAVLAAAGADLGNVLKVTVYVSDIEIWGQVNEVYAEFFGEHRPARCVVPTRTLHHGFQVEIEAVAFVGEAAWDA